MRGKFGSNSQELGETVIGPAFVMEDNNACIKIAENPIISQRSKSIDIRYHIVRHLIKTGEFKMLRVSTDDQVADGLTKGVGEDKIKLIMDRCFA